MNHVDRISTIKKDYYDVKDSQTAIGLSVLRWCIEDMLDSYTELRDAKDYAEADKVREWLVSEGFEIEIEKSGVIRASKLTPKALISATNYKYNEV